MLLFSSYILEQKERRSLILCLSRAGGNKPLKEAEHRNTRDHAGHADHTRHGMTISVFYNILNY